MSKPQYQTIVISGIYQSQLGAPRRISVPLTSKDLELIESVLTFADEDGDPAWDKNVQRLAALLTEAMG